MYHQIMNIHYDEKTLHAMNTAYFNNIYIFKKEENDLYCLYPMKNEYNPKIFFVALPMEMSINHFVFPSTN
jgi:hypothetical protein